MIQLPAGETTQSMQRTNQMNLTTTDLERWNDQRASYLEELFCYAQNVRRPMEKKWQTNYEFYYACDVEYKRKQPHQSKIVLPISYEIVETKTPQIVMNMFTQQPIYSLNPVGKDDPYKAILGEQLLSWQIRQQRNAMLTHTLWIKDSFIYGGAIAKTGWDYKCETVPRNVKLPPMLDFANMSILEQHNVINEKVVTADQPCLANTDIGEIYPDPTASNIEDCKFIIQRMLVPFIEVQRMAQLGIYKNVDKIQRLQNVVHWAGDFSERRYSTHNIQNPFQFTTTLYDYVEILEFWWIDSMDPELKKYKTVLANRKYIIQDIPLGQVYWHNRFPFILLKDTPMTKEFWGVSQIDVTMPLQKEANSLRNQRMDNTNQMLKAYWIVQRSAGINKEKMKRLAPGDIIFTNDINGIKADRPPSIDHLTMNAEQINRSDIQRASNLSDTMTGQPTRSQFRNATTASIMDQNAKTRWGLTVLLYTEQMQRVGEDFLALNSQFLTQPQVIAITGEDGTVYKVPVDYADIPRNPDVYVTLGYELQSNKDLRKQNLLQLDPILVSTPGFNVTEWRKDLMKEYSYKNPERYFEGAYVAPDEAFLGPSKMGKAHSSYTDQLAAAEGSFYGPGMPSNVGEQMENGVYNQQG